MKTTALLYSPEGGNVNKVTVMLGEVIGKDKADLIPVQKVAQGELDKYKQLIFVGSTVGADHWTNEIVADEWQEFFLKRDEISFENKKIAIVGLGNSVLYPEHFADGMADLYNLITERKGKVFGFVDGKDYNFTDSAAVNEDGIFCGLPIDEDNEEELTTERLQNWVSMLKPDFEF